MLPLNRNIMKQKYIEAHMNAAEVYSNLSSAVRLNVGCVIVKDNTIIGIGYNGMPSNWSNVCENKEYDENTDQHGLYFPSSDKEYPYEDEDGYRYKLVTKKEVLHAETNAIAKVARSTNSTEGASLFVTHAPCIECAKLIHQSGINNVFYRNTYRSNDGIDFLTECGIEVQKVE